MCKVSLRYIHCWSNSYLVIYFSSDLIIATTQLNFKGYRLNVYNSLNYNKKVRKKA